jgi:hypothetical protein
MERAMSDYPLRGEGIEIRENADESEQDRRKYNIHVDPQLYSHLEEAFNKNEWGTNDETGRRVFGYLATDEGFEAARDDDKCPG